MYQRRYETLLLIDAELTEEDQGQFKQKFYGILEQMKGRLIQEENWGRRRLAYPVKKQMHGVYFLMDYMGTPELLAELERNLRIDERVFKYMTQVLDKHFTEEKFEKAIEQLQLEQARQEAEISEREERRAAEEAENERPPVRPEPEPKPEPKDASPAEPPKPENVEPEEPAKPENVEPEEPAKVETAATPEPSETPEEESVESPVAASEPVEKPEEAATDQPTEEPVKE